MLAGATLLQNCQNDKNKNKGIITLSCRLPDDSARMRLISLHVNCNNDHPKKSGTNRKLLQSRYIESMNVTPFRDFATFHNGSVLSNDTEDDPFPKREHPVYFQDHTWTRIVQN
eukprot:scaffold4754_cov66-Cylindrotheca_fusiformis.AAC.3